MKALLYRSITVVCLICISHFNAQTFGPNNPSSGTNTTSIGSFAWTTPGNVVSSNNSYATVTSKGVTNYLSATNFGFSLPVTTAINGIQLDIEKSTLSPTIVTVLNNWTAGLTKTISTGSNRMLLFIASMENGSGARDITALRYGGQAMTQIVEGVVGTSGGFQAKEEFWVLLESGIASATSTAFTATFNTVTLTENVEYYASAVYAGVDQLLPYTTTQIYTTTATGATITVSPTLATTGGGMVVSSIHCGNNTTPGSSIGGTNTYSVSSTFTETIDTYTANAGFSTSGMCTEISHQAISSSGTVAPSYTFAGTPNRQIVIYVNLTCTRELDNSVRLIKSGTILGSDLAYTTSPWNTVDTYTSYGSSSTLWGTTWTVSDINATTFGAVISASVNNGTAQVDHMRITVTGSSTLPIELLDFYGEAKDNKHHLAWQTASEHQNKQFELERCDGIEGFERIATIAGKINSTVFNSYTFVDEFPLKGLNYYRLKQVDVDGSFKYSKIIVVNMERRLNTSVVYPNPSCDGRFTLASEQVLEDGVYIYSSDLKLIKKVNDVSNILNVSLTELTDGVYYLIYNLKGKQTIKQIQKVCR
jgi:hypothetical protein